MYATNIKLKPDVETRSDESLIRLSSTESELEVGKNRSANVY